MAHDAHHGAHAPAGSDKGAAFAGLAVGAVFIGALLFGMVKWTNHHLGAAEPGAAAEATK